MMIPQKDNTDYVKKYRAEGLNVIPCIEHDKLPLIQWKKYEDIKYNGVIKSDSNLAVICGKVSGNLVVVDIDKSDLDLVNKIYPDALKKTRVVRTGSGGYHLFFHVIKLPKKALRLNRDDGVHIDVQVDRTYVVVPPSIHPNGQEYQRVSDTDEITKIDFQEIVVNLEKAGFKVKLPSKENELVVLTKGGITKGTRHNSAIRYCHLLFYKQKLDQETVCYEMEKWNKTLHPPIEDEEIKKIIEDCIKYQKDNSIDEKGREPKGSHTKLGDDIMGKFYFKTLKETKEVLVYEHGIYTRYGDIVIETECQLEKHDCYNNLVSEVLGMVRRETYRARELFDNEPYLLNLENGILDIRDNSLVAHSPEKLFRVQLPLNYNPEIKPIKIMKFLNDILDYDYVEWVLDFIAYCLVRNCKQEKAMMFIGSGGNGKSTLSKLIFRFLGGAENVSSHSISELLYDTFASADLDGKLANIHPDIEADEIKKTGIIKALVSGDPMNVQKKNKDSFTMITFAKHIYSANRMPDIDGINEAFFQRWLVIDFNKTFRGTLEENKNLLDEITTPEELSGLLNVVMKRMPKLLEDKGVFKNAPTGEELRRVWKDHANSIESFINNQVEIEVGAVIMKNDLYKIYVLYCKDKKLSLFTEKTFSSRMKNSLIGKIEESVLKLHGKSNRVWRNIKVKNMPKGTELGETNQKIDSS